MLRPIVLLSCLLAVVSCRSIFGTRYMNVRVNPHRQINQGYLNNPLASNTGIRSTRFIFNNQAARRQAARLQAARRLIILRALQSRIRTSRVESLKEMLEQREQRMSDLQAAEEQQLSDLQSEVEQLVSDFGKFQTDPRLTQRLGRTSLW